MLKWLTYSGLVVTIALNPMHWRFVPWASRHSTKEWPVAQVWEGSAGWMFITIRLWIDDGKW